MPVRAKLEMARNYWNETGTRDQIEKLSRESIFLRLGDGTKAWPAGGPFFSGA